MNWVPVIGIFQLLRYSGSLDLILMNLLGNLLLLFPLGWLWVLLRKDKVLPWWKIWLYGVFCSLCIESFQLLFNLGCFDIDDILLNSLGYYYGFYMGNRWKIPQKNSYPVKAAVQ